MNTVYPKQYEMVREDFGEEQAERYLSLCRKDIGILGDTYYFATLEAREYAKSLYKEETR